jgi:hypothetical protein
MSFGSGAAGWMSMTWKLLGRRKWIINRRDKGEGGQDDIVANQRHAPVECTVASFP